VIDKDTKAARKAKLEADLRAFKNTFQTLKDVINQGGPRAFIARKKASQVLDKMKKVEDEIYRIDKEKS
jgi:hypothetical protein